ncbi:CxxxxCH/CxxCH domain-containing protein [Streptomyces bambusae]|uniref:CxxxxCH/CxxCH domain-containing protein n=1 Tax=Streptomyces bambusae TaxID=1550616 RepID=A0ABS6ZBF3_9ACTN|nr:CxxxxCH/CxxCH domain-containing protein [Streptomyces bambusae]
MDQSPTLRSDDLHNQEAYRTFHFCPAKPEFPGFPGRYRLRPRDPRRLGWLNFTGKCRNDACHFGHRRAHGPARQAPYWYGSKGMPAGFASAR